MKKLYEEEFDDLKTETNEKWNSLLRQITDIIDKGKMACPFCRKYDNKCWICPVNKEICDNFYDEKVPLVQSILGDLVGIRSRILTLIEKIRDMEM